MKYITVIIEKIPVQTYKFQIVKTIIYKFMKHRAIYNMSQDYQFCLFGYYP